MTTRLEHANLYVRDVDATTEFLRCAFPDFEVRGEGVHQGRRWVHVGNDDTYIALNQATEKPAERWEPYVGKPGVNHLGYEVDDAEALRERMRAAGYHNSTVPNDHPYRKRVYFYDPDGNDWEFVQYLSNDPAKRNDYDLVG
jgi:catechol 2,3-dioxygenase-like lactoylglutathione lyase family enzyme